MTYSESELLSELKKCYEEHGEASSKILNDSTNDYPTQPTYQNHFGSFSEARMRAGLPRGTPREKVINDIEECFDKYGDVTISLISKDNDLISPNTLYQHFDSIGEAIEQSQVNGSKIPTKSDRRKQYTEEDLIESLVECHESTGKTDSKTVNEYEHCPSTQPYKDRFGSLDRARIIAEVSRNEITKKSEAVEIVNSTDEYYDDDDAHVYVLTISINDQECYYVGESTSLIERITSHMRSPDIRTYEETTNGKAIVPRKETPKKNSVKIESIEALIPMNKSDGETEIEFRRRRKYKEHETALSMAIEKNTTMVFGGK